MIGFRKIVSASALMLAIPSQLLAQDWRPAVEAVTAQLIQPGYQQLASSFERLNQRGQALCEAPTENTYQATQIAWKEAMSAWMQVSWIHFGPISSSTGRFDIQIWPIRKGITHKTMKSLLGDSALDAKTVDQVGVSVRGLTGTEYLLFSGSGGQLSMYQDNSRSNRCLILERASINAGNTATNLAQAWQQSELIGPFKQGVDMLDETQVYASAASIIWNALLAELEFIQLRKLEGPLNIHGKKAKPTYAESWRSLNSFENIQHQIVQLKKLYQVGFEQAVLTAKPSLNKQVLDGFDDLSSQLAAFKAPMKALLKAEAGRANIEAFRSDLAQHYQLMRSEVTPITGFVLGFNANDGD